jgi:neutral trehalase
MNEKLWDGERGIYLDFDLVTNEPLRVYVAAGFSPLFAGIPDENRARFMLNGPENCGLSLREKDAYPVPSYDRYGYGFSPVQYWRGPVWVNLNWLLLRGLQRYDFEEQAEHLRQVTLDLVRQQGFYEYFHPTTGNGHGSDLFSWTAALFLDMLLEETVETDG